MRDKFTKTLQDERVAVSDGTFDDTHIEGGWADAVIIAQVGPQSTEKGNKHDYLGI